MAADNLSLGIELSHSRYFIDSSVSSDIRGKLALLLQSLGATPCALAPDLDEPEASTSSTPATKTCPFDIDDVTHIITMTPNYLHHADVKAFNNEKYTRAKNAGRHAGTAPLAQGQRGELIAVTTPRWLTRTVDLKRRQDEATYSPDPNLFFSGVVVCTEDLPKGDSETIKGIVSALGGSWRANLVIEVTHLISTKPRGKKYDRIMETGWKYGIKAILPHWIDDCVKMQRRCPEDEYLFPNPPLLSGTADYVSGKGKNYLDRIADQLSLGGRPQIVNQTRSLLEPQLASNHPDNLNKRYLDALAQRHDYQHQEPTVGMFEGRKLYIAQTCELTAERLSMLGRQMEMAGGQLLRGETTTERLDALSRADYVVVNHREGWEYWEAYDKQKEIGNLDWLVYVLFASRSNMNDPTSASTLPAPMDRLLHYPWPKTPVPGFGEHVITISSYAGAARDSIKKLIEVMGGRFEGNMTKGKTTHVISAVPSGNKVQHARLWNIFVLNHLWIEECYLSWTSSNPAVQQFISYDGTESYVNMVGTRTISPGAIAEWAISPDAQRSKAAALAILEAELSAPLADGDDEIMMNGKVEKTESAHLLITPDPMPETDPPTPALPPRFDSLRQPLSDPRAVLGGSRPPPTPQPLPSEKTEVVHTAVGDFDMVDMDEEPPSSSAADGQEREALQQELVGKLRQPLKRKSPPPQGNASTSNQPKTKVLLSALSSDAITEEDTPSPQPTPKRKAKPRRQSLQDGWIGTPRASSGRKAATAAAQKLHDTIMPDVLAFAKEKQGGGKKRLDELFGGNEKSADKRPGRKSKLAASMKEAIRRAPSSSEDEDTDGDSDPGDIIIRSCMGRDAHNVMQQPATSTPNVVATKGRPGRPSRLRDLDNVPPYQASDNETSMTATSRPRYDDTPVALSKVFTSGKAIKLATTGVQLDANVRRQLIKMGARITDEPATDCTHLIVRNASRTIKFLTCISSGAYFVNEEWAVDSVRRAKFLDETPYLLKDKAGEKNYDFNLAASLTQARRTKVFQDMRFYLTANVTPDFKSLKTIAEAGGAKVFKKNPTLKNVQDEADTYVFSSEQDIAAVQSIIHNGIPVYIGEAIIRSTLTQQVEFEPHTLELDED